MPSLTFDRYGKTRVRLLQVLRTDSGHEIVEINLTILFEGDLKESYTSGDNSRVLPTDTMKNTVYALSRQNPIESVEAFGLCLGEHFLHRLPHIDKIKVSIHQIPWNRIASHSSAFTQNEKEQPFAHVTVTRGGRSVVSGFRNLQILKTSGSAFFGYLKDEYTTLPETRDRLLGTVLDAEWVLSSEPEKRNFNELHADIRNALLDCFARHESLSVQHTLYAMASDVLDSFNAVQEIHLTMPNKHCLLVDLSRFGLDNPNQIFVPTDEPSGYIEARLRR
ncbi:MAG: urate oxidase [Acidobacteriaceae bacterium]|nr:urate oxidase [Acidobacteriaceae bacterium]